MTQSLTELLSVESRIRKLNVEPFDFLEGPVWDAKRNQLYFTDPLAQKIIVMPSEGRFYTLMENSGYANGMCQTIDNHLAICKMDEGAVYKLDADCGKLLYPIADCYNGKPFCATNDVICDDKGGYYFTDPFFTYGPNSQPGEYTYYCSPEGWLEPVAEDCLKPNGLALSPDRRRLYIADTGSVNVWQYNVLSDGRLSHARVFCKLNPPPDAQKLPHVQQYGEADGLKVDTLGNVYIATISGIQVFNTRGKPIGTLPIPGTETAANLAFGGLDRKTMYITARTSLFAIDMLVSGCG